MNLARFACCPKCGCEFEDLRFYTISQIAVVLGITEATVKDWLAKGKLRFRLYARSSNSIIRVIDSRDLREFIDRRYPYPGQDSNSLASRLWAWVQRSGSKGGQTTAERKRLKKADEQSE
jgi:predicted transcriptional regulator